MKAFNLSVLALVTMITFHVHGQNVPGSGGDDEGGAQAVSDYKFLKLEQKKILQLVSNNWQKCFKVKAPELKSLSSLASTIVTVEMTKKLKTVPEQSNCQAALDDKFQFSEEALCLVDESVAQGLYEFTENKKAHAYLGGWNKNSEASDLLNFYRKLNKAKMDKAAKVHE
jgi:hypothetical protein